MRLRRISSTNRGGVYSRDGGCAPLPLIPPTPYLGIALKAAGGDSGWQPLRRKETE